MARILLLLFVLLLFACSYYLLQKPSAFFVLLKNDEENNRFLRHFGVFYAFLGILGILMAIVNHQLASLIYLFFVIASSAIFGFRFAKKITVGKG